MSMKLAVLNIQKLAASAYDSGSMTPTRRADAALDQIAILNHQEVKDSVIAYALANIHDCLPVRMRTIEQRAAELLRKLAKLTPTQEAALARMIATGQPLVRWPGGFWTTAGTPQGPFQGPAWSVPKRSMEALERTGLICRANKYAEEWRDERVLAVE